MSFITENDIIKESQDCFLTYAEEVLTDRAIPSAEDGLLSAQRKILWTMTDVLKMNEKSKTKKCNAIVGSTLATSYFHGDAACYGVLTKMSQTYLMRYQLIDGQGSLGTQESNSLVASSRYTEAKPSKYADLMMTDYKKNVVPTKETYNGEYQEPVFLPSLFPNAICNGRQTIGISMAHNSLPHNLTEVCNGIIAYLKKNDITIDEIMQYIPGPDFPLENVIVNSSAIREAFATGKSGTSLKVRGVYHIEGNNKIVFDTIPYRTYRDKIKEKITKNADDLEKFIDDFDDESALGKNRLVFTVKKGVSIESAIEALFLYTDLQSTVSYNMNFIVNGTPKLCSLLDLIKAYSTHQENVLIAATNYDLDKAKARKHILEGLIIVIQDIDTAIKIIKESDNKDRAAAGLMTYFGITEKQAEAVLDMKLARLTKLDTDKLRKELQAIIDQIAEFEKILNDKEHRISILINKITELRNKYGDARKTKLMNITMPKKEKEERVIPDEENVVVVTKNGDVKRIAKSKFKVQKRNTKGIKNYDGVILSSSTASTIDNIMVFTNLGRVYKMSVFDLPEGTNTAKGTNFNSLFKFSAGEKVMATTIIPSRTGAKYVCFVTKNGMLKKTSLDEYSSTSNRANGIIGIKIKEGDSIVDVLLTDNEEVVIGTKKGQCVRYTTEDINPIGRVTIGIKGIKLNEGDEVITAKVIEKNKNLLIATKDGYAKRIDINEITVTGKNTKGVVITNKTELAGLAFVDDNDSILVIGDKSSVCIDTKEIPILSKSARGNILIKDNNSIYSITKV